MPRLALLCLLFSVLNLGCANKLLNVNTIKQHEQVVKSLDKPIHAKGSTCVPLYSNRGQYVFVFIEHSCLFSGRTTITFVVLTGDISKAVAEGTTLVLRYYGVAELRIIFVGKFYAPDKKGNMLLMLLWALPPKP